jgi:hypothetical protein
VYQGQAQSERLMVIVGLMAATTIEVEWFFSYIISYSYVGYFNKLLPLRNEEWHSFNFSWVPIRASWVAKFSPSKPRLVPAGHSGHVALNSYNKPRHLYFSYWSKFSHVIQKKSSTEISRAPSLLTAKKSCCSSTKYSRQSIEGYAHGNRWISGGARDGDTEHRDSDLDRFRPST